MIPLPKRTLPIVGWLPRAFIGLAFLNFLVGAVLGGWMASDFSAWATVGPIHGEINPFGWLTTLIYGMTYAVLSISAGLRPPKAWIGWTHCVVSELAIFLVTASYLANSLTLMRVGLVLQFAAPILFLVNILTAVASKRQMHKEQDVSETDERHQDPLAALRKGPAYQDTDRVAQRGTDVSLMLLILGTFWMLLHALTQEFSPIDQDMPQGALFLVYYGWIGGTVLSVALHLFPRIVGVTSSRWRVAARLQLLWGTSILLGIIGSFGVPMVKLAGYRLLGVSLLGYAVMFLWALAKFRRIEVSTQITVGRSSLVAWWASWAACFLLGVGLVCGLNPFSLLALHLFFLAFATNLVYGIGYTLFPLLLKRSIPSSALSLTQVIIAIVGVFLMALAFYGTQTGHTKETWILLGIGGTCAALGAVLFLFQWPFARSSSKRTVLRP